MIISSIYQNKSLFSKFLERNNKLDLYCYAELKNNSEKKESRIGKKSISVPKDVKATLYGQKISVQGPNGDSSIVLDDCMIVSIDDDQIKVIRKDDSRRARQLHGLSRTLLNNMIIGISVGFEKKLTLVGVGYKAKVYIRARITSCVL
jgi:ribosomal protein L6P/L9E